MEPKDRFNLPNYNKPILTKITEEQGAQALYDAWYDIYDEYPNTNQLAVLLAKTALETGRFKSCFNYNFGNIKCNYKKNQFTMYKCGELIKGKYLKFEPPHIQCVFRSYNSLKEGAVGYIEFVSQKRRYKKAWQEVINGDPKQYVIELKKAGYFTAELEPYMRAVISLFNEYKVKIKKWNIFPTMTPEDIKKYEQYENKQIMNLVNKTLFEKK